MQIYTIGHSNHMQEEFLDLLAKAKIEVLVDVRSNPDSRWAPFANKENLEGILKAAQIRYIYSGNVLGGHPAAQDCYNPDTGEVDYKAIQGKEYYKSGIKQILDLLKSSSVCIMCAEENPTSCHRNCLVAESLRQEGVSVFHIRGDGRIQTDEELRKEKLGIAANQLALL